MSVVNSFKKKCIDQVLALGTLKAMILSNVHTTDVDSQEFIDDISANEITGTNYTAGGQSLIGVTTTIDAATDKVKLDCSDIVFANLTISAARYIAYYIDTGTPSTSPIISIIDLGADQDRVAQPLTIEINADGILDLT